MWEKEEEEEEGMAQTQTLSCNPSNMHAQEKNTQAMTEEEHADFLEQELWVKEHFKEWKQAKEDEMRAKMSQSGRYKQYRRYMKNHGPDRMTFDDS